MSGSAALSAAKRRRAVSTDGKPPTTSKSNTNTSTIQQKQQINPLQVLNQHHMKLDVLYQRQSKIYKMLNIEESIDGEESIEGEESGENIIDRLENIEKQVINKTPVNNEENELLQQIDGFKAQVDELRKIILNVQSHSINVSLEMLELKNKMDNVNIETENNNDAN
jgi:hypothetical protein|tara:strand:- start:162 stop:662 length:501 start_codon:yes stop_codon:yes gene_type:complete